MSEPGVVIEAVCLRHPGSGHLLMRREEGRIVLDGHTDHCCVIAVRDPAATLLSDMLGKWLG